MLVDNILPELKLKQSSILTMGNFNFDLQNKNFRFSEFMEHTFSSKQIVSKVTRKYESLLAFLKVYPAKFYLVSDYRLSRASSWSVTRRFVSPRKVRSPEGDLTFLWETNRQVTLQQG